MLFPCGHTFCKKCISEYAKVKKMCPFCRSKFESMAPNLSLQNLIQSATEKKPPPRQPQFDTQKAQEQEIGTLSNQEADSYIQQFRVLAVKHKVMNDELRQAEKELSHVG